MAKRLRATAVAIRNGRVLLVRDRGTGSFSLPDNKQGNAVRAERVTLHPKANRVTYLSKDLQVST